MEHLGIHLLIEFWYCNKIKLNLMEYIEKSMIKAAETSGATVLKSAFQNFNPQGVSGVVIIAESHLTIHTWPEYGYAAVDIFTCGTKVDPWKASECLEKDFEVGSVEITDMFRGIIKNPGGKNCESNRTIE